VGAQERRRKKTLWTKGRGENLSRKHLDKNKKQDLELIMRELSPEIEEKLARIESMVGNTPLLKLDFVFHNKPVSIFAKYEAVNFSGSIKDRMAIKILRHAYTTGILNPGDLIVEATSGNTGIAFSAMGAFLDHPVKIYMPEWMSEERKALMRLYGAEVVEVTQEQGGFLGSMEMAAADAEKEGVFCPSQFSNWQNVEAHRETTGPEIAKAFADLGLRPDAFVAGAGTGGTIMGVSSILKMENINLKSHPVFPLNHEENGGTHRIEGIGDSFVPKILKLNALHSEIRVDDEDAIVVAQMLNQKGLSAGISSGANVWAALSIASKGGKNVATVLCDSAMKYLTTDLCKPAKKAMGDLKFVGFDRVD